MRLFYQDRLFVGSLFLAMGMVAAEVSLWMSFFSVLILMWKWGQENWGWPFLSRKITGALSVLLLLGIWLEFRTVVGQEASFTFLLGLAALKVMDYTNERDHRILVMLGFLMLGGKALFSLDIYWIIPTVLSFVGLWGALLPSGYSVRGHLLRRIFLLSAPLGVILFIFFPRVVIPWAMSQNPLQAQIGFSEELSPGNVASLASQKQLVLRAKLDRELSQQELYWRGSVLKKSLGLQWRPMMLLPGAGRELAPGGFSYEVALEPLVQKYLFVLEGTTSIQVEGQNSLDLEAGVFRASRPFQKTLAYRAQWSGQPERGPQDFSDYLEHPPLRGKVAQWVEEIRNRYSNPVDRLTALEKFFSDEGFVYTLNPGTYGNNGMEEFLFKRRQGFCEHYAGAYATLARALGWPSRVVVGYQGGRHNKWADFWVVTQQDAHAWVEILKDGVWQRKDPTQWVAPLRLEIGAEDFFTLSPEDQKAFSRNRLWRPSGMEREDFLSSVTSWFEGLNYQWTYFLLEFERGGPWQHWQDFKNFVTQWALALVFCFVLLISGLFLYFWVRRKRMSPLERKFKKLEKWGQRQQIVRPGFEPPLTYVSRLRQQLGDLPPWAQQIEEDFAKHYRMTQ